MVVWDVPSSIWPWRRTRNSINGYLACRGGLRSLGMTTTRSWGLHRAVAYRDLEELVRHRLFAPAGAGRGTRYYVAMDGWGADAPGQSLDDPPG